MTGDRYLRGYMTVKITAAEISQLLTALCDAGFELRDICSMDPLSATTKVPQNAYNMLAAFVEKRGGAVVPLRGSGAFPQIHDLVRRPILIIGILLIILLSVVIPKRILFIHVDGNAAVPEKLILEQAEAAGIRVGTSRREIRNEAVKNHLLEQIPALQWVGINTKGCVAVISVRERIHVTEALYTTKVSSIVAARDGIITSCTAVKGDLLCKVGQAVQEGEVLISGYKDVGLCIRATRSEGEIFATTKRNQKLLLPLIYEKKGEQAGSSKKISLIIGKKHINFCNDSRILGGICDRMYEEYYITLPGGFRLPVGIAVETVTEYAPSGATELLPNAERLAEVLADDYLCACMLSGKILQVTRLPAQSDGVCSLNSRYVCIEQIGVEKNEENLESYGKNG